MWMITCTVTGNREPASLDAVRSIANLPDAIELTVSCPACGQEHVHRTGRRVEEARRARSVEVAVRRAAAGIPA